MAYWLLKSEPEVFSWDQLVKDKKTSWTGVRNYTARNNLMAMKKGEQGFFYHSNTGVEIVGIVEVTKEHAPDPTDKTGKFVTLEVKPVKSFKTPVTLHMVKADPLLKNMELARLSRLSVSKVSTAEWKKLLKLGGL